MRKNSHYQADIKNPNKGMPGTNPTWDHAQRNRGKQMNPHWTPPASGQWRRRRRRGVRGR